MNHKILLTVAALAFVSLPAMAQYDINPKLGYYYWDMVGIQGQETIATGTDKTKTETREYNVTRLEYLYDFCGKADFFLGFAGSKGRLTAAAGEHDNDYETNTAEIFIGPYFKVGDYADAYVRAGQIISEGYFLDFWGPEYEERSMLELGFRSRVGERRNLELINNIRYEDLYKMQVQVGFLYHSAAAFSIGMSYRIKGDVEAERLLNDELVTTHLTGQDEVSFTLRINL